MYYNGFIYILFVYHCGSFIKSNPGNKWLCLANQVVLKCLNIHLKTFRPFAKNPSIAKVFWEIGLADELGSGMRNSYKYTKMYSGGEPVFTEADVFTTVIPLSEAATATVGPTVQTTPQVAVQDLEQKLEKLIEFCSIPRSRREMMDHMGLTDSKSFRKRYLNTLIEAGKIEMTIPNKPNSPNQKYRKK